MNYLILLFAIGFTPLYPAPRPDPSAEIVGTKYIILHMVGECVFSRDMPKYRKAVSDAFFDDGKITNKEFDQLMDYFSRISMCHQGLDREMFKKDMQDWKNNNYRKAIDGN